MTKGGKNLDSLIEKMQQLNSVFMHAVTAFTPLNALCDQLCNIVGCNIYIFDTTGHIFAYSIADRYVCPYSECSLENEELPPYYLEMFHKADQAITSQYQRVPVCTYNHEGVCVFDDRYFSLYPIYTNFRKSAGILLIRYGSSFSENDKVLCEYTNAIVSLEMLRQEQERTQQLAMEAAAARLAVSSLTYSELKAVLAVLEELGGDSGNVFLNGVASRSFSTQSTVTSALKKLEGAGVIATKSQGVKGKYIRVTNKRLFDELYMAEKRNRKERRGSENR